MRLVAACAVAALLLAPTATATERHPTLNELENEVMCPVCGTTLSQSDSPAAQQIKQFIRDEGPKNHRSMLAVHRQL